MQECLVQLLHLLKEIKGIKHMEDLAKFALLLL